MSYVVLARKYRPLRFADMIGQEHIGRTLGNAITQDRVHHAYLFAGARGLGKTTTARIFAKALVCEQGPTPEPCNACAQCVAVTEGRSVDVIEIDGASNNSVENIRALREQVHYLPQSARRKVYIIDEVHMLTTSAFNALLKTLEEPPAHVNFVFATTEAHKVLPTILSRVSRLDFRRVSIGEIVAHLQSVLQREQLAVEPAGLHLVARAAGGSVRDAMTLLDQVLAFADDPKAVSEAEARAVLGQAERTAVAGLVDAILARDPDRTMASFDALAAGGIDLTVLSLQLLEDLRDLAIARTCRTRDAFIDATADELDELVRRAQAVPASLIAQAFDRLWRVIDRLATARSQRLVLEMGLLELAQAEPVLPLGDLIERLEALGEGRPSGGSTPPRSSSSSTAPPRSTPPGRSSGRAPTGTRQGAAPDDDVPPPPEPPEVPHATASATSTDVPAHTRPGPSHPAAGASATSPSASATSPSESATSPGASATRPGASATSPGASATRPGASPSPAITAPEPAAAVATQPAAAPAADAHASPFMRDLWAMAHSSGVIAPGSAAAAPATPASPAPAPRNGKPVAGPIASSIENAPAIAVEPAPPAHSPVCAPPPVIRDPAEDPFGAWTALVAWVREDDEYVSAMLGEVGLAHYGGGSLRLAAPRGSFAHEGLTSERRARLEQLAREQCGAPVVVELVDEPASLPDCPSLVLVERRRREELRAQVEAEARVHPAITALLRDFEAQLATTRPLGDR